MSYSNLYRKVGVALVLGALFTILLTYAYPLIYRQVEINLRSKVYYGFWFEVEPNLPSGVEVYTIYHKKDIGIRITQNYQDLLIGKLYYRSDYTENPKRTSWRVKIYVDILETANGTALLRIEAGKLCYINIRDRVGNSIVGYGLGCFDYSYNRIAILEVALTRSGTYEFYINHQYLWEEYRNPPDYPPWASFNIYLTVDLPPGSSWSSVLVVRYEAY